MAKPENGMLALEAEDASISTATITIRAIQVGKRQMTQSVFRQLPAARLVDEDEVRLLGVPWGWVNYHWGDIPTTHTQFLFQVGDRLYRNAFRVRTSETFSRSDFVTRAFLNSFQCRWTNLVAAHNCAAVLEGWRPEPAKDSCGYTIRRWSRNYVSAHLFAECDWALNETGSLDCLLELEPPPYVGRDESRFQEWTKDLDDRREKVNVKLVNKIKKALGCLLTTAEIERRISVVESQGADYCRRWDAMMRQLRGVEQLFIAC